MSNFLQYLKTELDERWQESVSGRVQDVPYPGDDRVFIDDITEKVRSSPKANPDYIVLSRGTATKEPRGFGHTHRRRETTVTISCRSTGERGRVFGVRDGNNDCEDYGGLVGEVERVLDEIRKGDKEFDRVLSPETRDVSNLADSGTWRGEVEVSAEILAEVIDP